MALALDSTIANWTERARNSGAGRFWYWWSGELKSMLPEPWLEVLGAQSHQVLVRRQPATDDDGPGWQLGLDGRTDASVQLEPGEDATLLRQRLDDLLVEQHVEDPEYTLLLPPEMVLRRQVSLPLAAEKELGQALRFDLDRQTPFRSEDVYYDYRVLNRRVDAGLIDVELVVAPREGVDEIIEELRQTGLPLHRVALDENGRTVPLASGPGFNLLPREARDRRINRRMRINALLAMLAVALLLVVMWQSVSVREAKLETLTEATDEARREAQLVKNMDNEYQDAMRAASFLAREKGQRAPVIDIMAEVTRVVPEDTYLSRLVVEECEISMQGLSAGAQRLIQVINESELMSEAAFRGPIQTDPRTSLERFNLVARLQCEGVA